MTIAQMRGLLGLDNTVSDVDVVLAYSAMLNATDAPVEVPPIVTLTQAKLWLRYDGDGEDGTLQILIAAATEAICAHIEPAFADGDVPARLKLAVLTHVANAFSNREDGADLPASAQRLLNPMRTLDI